MRASHSWVVVVCFIAFTAQATLAADDLQAAKDAGAEGRYEDALNAVNLLLQKSPGDTKARAFRALTLAILDRNIEAIKDYDIVLKANPHYPFALAGKAAAEYGLLNYDATWKLANQALLIDPHCVRALCVRAWVNEVKKRFAEAFDDANKAVELEPKNMRGYLARAGAENCLGRYADAARDAQEAERLEPKNPQAYSAEALALQNQNKPDLALEVVNKGLERATQDPRTLEDLYISRADLKAMVDPLDETIRDDYDKAVASTPWRSYPYAQRARYLVKVGHKEDAFRDANKVVELEPRSAYSYYQRARTYGLAAANIDRMLRMKGMVEIPVIDEEGDDAQRYYRMSIDDYSKALSLERNNTDCLYNRAFDEMRIGKNTPALKDASAYIKLLPKDADGYKLRSQIRKRMNDLKGAEADSDRADELKEKKEMQPKSAQP